MGAHGAVTRHLPSTSSLMCRQDPHKITKGMDACASSYVMYRNVTKHIRAFFNSIYDLEPESKVTGN
jgi:hypothetical protein